MMKLPKFEEALVKIDVTHKLEVEICCSYGELAAVWYETNIYLIPEKTWSKLEGKKMTYHYQ